jgi:hypothetical protein
LKGKTDVAKTEAQPACDLSQSSRQPANRLCATRFDQERLNSLFWQFA